MSGSLSSSAGVFTGEIEATPLTGKYKLGLVLVAFGMVLLLAAYVGLIALVSCGVYYQFTHLSQILNGTNPNSGSFLTCVGLPFSGIILVFFMVKPFFAGRAPEPDRYTLTPKSDPELFNLIANICALVKAPSPSRVDVDCQVNASVRFRRGWRSMKGNDLVLTIGLPLAGGLTVQEFAGVLAHEFGHFAQGAGMRLTYLIRAISGWFARVVYERDEWDLRLANVARRIDIRISIILHITRLCIWVSRRILWVFMHLGRIFSGFMLRQMEFDADSYETKVAGSAAFEQTTAKIQKLNAATQWAHVKIKESWRSRKLPEDLPAFIHFSVTDLPDELQKQVVENAAKKKTGIWDTHPCDLARVQAAAAMNQPGVLHNAEPAQQLFNGFDGLCKGASRFHYESNLELRITDQCLVPTEITARESQARAEGTASYGDFFHGVKFKFRPILLSADDFSTATPEILMENIRAARQAMEDSKLEVIKTNREFEEAEALYQRGLDAIASNSQTATDQALATMANLSPTLATFEKHAQTRLTSALLLLRCPDVAKNISNAAALETEMDQLTPVFHCLGQIFPAIQELRRKTEALHAALKGCADPSKNRVALANARAEELRIELLGILARLKPNLNEAIYPFHHSRTDMTLAEYARTNLPATHQLEVIYNNSSSHINCLLSLYHRVLGRLTFMATKVEEAIPASSLK